MKIRIARISFYLKESNTLADKLNLINNFKKTKGSKPHLSVYSPHLITSK